MAIVDPTQSPKQPPLGGTIGTDDKDTLYGTRDGDVIQGLKGDDTIYGYGGNDWLYGGSGWDTLYGGDNSDHLFGGDEPDFLDGEEGDDYLYGGSSYDTLYGGKGNDHLYGQDAEDSLIGGAGADILNGGAGGDTVLYFDSPTGVTVNLTTGIGSGGDAAGDTYYGIENVQGSPFEDTLIGSGDLNYLRGLAGDDHLFGFGSNDYLVGGDGADDLDGGDGTDTASYDSSPAGVTVNLAAGTASGGDAEGDTFASIENLWGSKHDDTLTGNDEPNRLTGHEGNDTLLGGGGPDTFAFGNWDTIGPVYDDQILDFNQGDGDRIDLTALTYGNGPPSLDFIGDAAFSGVAGQVRFELSKVETLVSADTDGDGQADLAIRCPGMIIFNATDFLL